MDLDFMARAIDQDLTLLCHEEIAKRLGKVVRECLKHRDPGTNTEDHRMAAKVLKIVEGEA